MTGDDDDCTVTTDDDDQCDDDDDRVTVTGDVRRMTGDGQARVTGVGRDGYGMTDDDDDSVSAMARRG